MNEINRVEKRKGKKASKGEVYNHGVVFIGNVGME